ncbi:DUF6019 family protein [Ruminococcus sp. zg-924]|uniref:DUF6019 family protein n=1 Tax=unclassified Ruminococcus TaxID=2608920 RepID=UPI00351E123D
MHLDWIVSDLLSGLGLTAGALIVFAAGLTLFYFVVKWAVRNGVREALNLGKKEHGESKDAEDKECVAHEKRKSAGGQHSA